MKWLEENGLLTASTDEVMCKMAKFRNIVVYHYEEVDTTIELTILKKHVDDFFVFRDAILTQFPRAGPGVCL